jgi:hypothetical protein
LPLATLDKKLAATARLENIPVLGAAGRLLIERGLAFGQEPYAPARRDSKKEGEDRCPGRQVISPGAPCRPRNRRLGSSEHETRKCLVFGLARSM